MSAWMRVTHFDRRAAALADRHYSRRTIGAPQFMPPGRKLVLLTPKADAVWGTSWPYANLVMHDYGDSWLCSIFRNESESLSSDLIRDAVAVTRWHMGEAPVGGFLTFVNAKKVKHKRDPGRCFLRAGFRRAKDSKSGLIALVMSPAEMPEAHAPIEEQTLFDMTGGGDA